MKRLIGALLVSACTLLLLSATGCEVESTDQASVTIIPRFATIKKGQSITFTASGWSDYRWSLSEQGLGILDREVGSSVTYTAVQDSSNIQALTVTGGSTNRGTAVSASVNIQHELLNPVAAALTSN
jgi:hypothetical protein